MIIEKKKLKDEIKRIYISGPITGVENWQETFLTAEKELCEMSGIFFVINPIYIAERVEKNIKNAGLYRLYARRYKSTF